MSAAYLLFNIGTLCSALWLTRRFTVHLSWQRLLRSYLLVSIPFIVWDIWAVGDGHWGFSADYTMGLHLFGLAIEEILFFFTVPLVCLVVFLALSNSQRLQRPGVAQFSVALIGLAGLLMATVWPEQAYTRTVGITLLLSSAILLVQHRLIEQRKFWVFQAILFGLFVAANTFLTALPIITYGEQAVIGFRIGTIPVEDFAYNFALINLFVVSYIAGKYERKNYG